MHTLVIILHVVVCFALIMIILLQAGKGADMGAIFGGSSQTLFGSSGPAPFLAKLTAGAAIAFMFTSLFLAYFAGNRPASTIMRGGVPQSMPPVNMPSPGGMPPMPAGMPAPAPVAPPSK